MKKKSFKVLAAALGLMILLTAVGCKEEKGLTKITMWTGDSHSKAVMTQLTDEFNKTIGKKNGIEFVYEVKDATTMSNIDLAVQNGEGPDFLGAGQLEKYVEKEYIVPINKLPGGDELIKRFDGQLVEGWHTYKGETYTVPQSLVTMGLLYNKEMFKAAGIVDENGEAKPPETFAEFREDAKILTNAADKKYGVILPIKWSVWFGYEVENVIMSSAGRKGYDPRTGTYDYSVLKPLVETVMDIKKDGSYYPGAETIDNDAARARFSDGNIGMKIGYSWDVGVLNDQFPANFDWGVAPLPVADANKKYMQNAQPTMAPTISKKALDTIGGDKLMVVYEWLTSDKHLRDMYEGGVTIPWNHDIIKDADVSKAKKGWKEFGDMLNISVTMPIQMQTDISSYDGMQTKFANIVWSGKGTIDSFLDEATKAFNDGIGLYKKLHPDFDGSSYIKPEWNIERQD